MQVAQTMVPFMAIGYVITALLLIVLNLDELPVAIALILICGIGSDQIFGGPASWCFSPTVTTSRMQLET